MTSADPVFGQGGPASEAKSCQSSGAESCEWSKLAMARVQGFYVGQEAFGFLLLKYAFSHILETLFPLIFNIYFNTKSW